MASVRKIHFFVVFLLTFANLSFGDSCSKVLELLKEDGRDFLLPLCEACDLGIRVKSTQFDEKGQKWSVTFAKEMKPTSGFTAIREPNTSWMNEVIRFNKGGADAKIPEKDGGKATMIMRTGEVIQVRVQGDEFAAFSLLENGRLERKGDSKFLHPVVLKLMGRDIRNARRYKGVYLPRKDTHLVDIHNHFAAAFDSDDIITAYLRANRKKGDEVYLLRELLSSAIEATKNETKPVTDEIINVKSLLQGPKGQNPEALREQALALLHVRSDATIGFQENLRTIYAARNELMRGEFKNQIMRDGGVMNELLPLHFQRLKKEGIEYVELSTQEITDPIRMKSMVNTLMKLEAKDPDGPKIRFQFAISRGSNPNGLADERTGNIETSLAKIEALMKDKMVARYIKGIDFVGEEKGPILATAANVRVFKGMIKKLDETVERIRKTYPDFHVQMHAGEFSSQHAQGPMKDNVYEALYTWGATKIAHGMGGIDDDTMEGLRRLNTFVAFSPTSVIATEKATPETLMVFKDMINRGVFVIPSTDGGGVFRTTVSQELALMENLGFTKAEINKMITNQRIYLAWREYGFDLDKMADMVRVSHESSLGVAKVLEDFIQNPNKYNKSHIPECFRRAGKVARGNSQGVSLIGQLIKAKRTYELCSVF